MVDKILYVFDVDGTLTPCRQKMNESFKEFFLNFFETRSFVLVSGSDYHKIKEQVGDEVINKALCICSCSGNDVWIKNTCVFENDWSPSSELLQMLKEELSKSEYAIRTGNHVETRTGSINFSIVGRNCTQEQRDTYFAWDLNSKERFNICNRIRSKFPDLECNIGGQISIDIHPQGADKSQILEILPRETIYFFGDGIEPGKNDYSIAQILKEPSKSFPVNSWEDTKKILDSLTHL